MNDTELDDMLNQWKAPEPGAELRARVRAMEPRKRRFAWPAWESSKGLIFGLAAGAAMFLFVVGIAVPQTGASGSIRFLVESEYITHHGSTAFTEYRAEYLRNGVPTTLSSSFPDDPLMTLHNRFFYAMKNLFYPVVRQIHGDDGSEAYFANLVHDGCILPGPGKFIGHEKILGHDTVISQMSGWTEWRALDLGCMKLKDTFEQPNPDGTLHLVREMRALRIKMSRPQ